MKLKNHSPSFFALVCAFALTGCGIFKTARVGKSVEEAKKRICLNSEGKGRFIFQGQKHIFSYLSHFTEAQLRWTTAIDFPVYGRESIDLEWNSVTKKADYDASYEEALLKNSQDLNPALLEGATEMWLEFFEDILVSRGLLDKDRGQKISWKVTDKSLEGSLTANGYPAQIIFLNPVSDTHFGRFDFKLLDEKGERQFGMELIVRNCLEKAD